ncbi:MAG: hypothetical protein RIF33_04215 [Cyclobacteriaceae bacterium]
MLSYLLVYLHVMIGSLLHPFHISVLDMEYDEDSKAIEISCRIFLDDLEETLRAYSDEARLDIMDEASREKVHIELERYFREKVKISVNGKTAEMNYLGEEIDGDVMWCYIEIAKVKKLQSIEVENQLLLDSFDDQMNLVHMKAFGSTKSLKLYQFNEWGEITY